MKLYTCCCRSNLAALDLQSVAGVPGLGSVADYMRYSLSNRSAGGLIGATNAYRKLDRQMASYVANGWLQLDVPQPSASIPPFQECPSLEATVRVSANASSNVSGSSSTGASTGGGSSVVSAGSGVIASVGNALGRAVSQGSLKSFFSNMG